LAFLAGFGGLAFYFARKELRAAKARRSTLDQS
jgi:hypothetical protein